MQKANLILRSIFLLFIFLSQVFLSVVFNHGLRAQPTLGFIVFHQPQMWVTTSVHAADHAAALMPGVERIYWKRGWRVPPPTVEETVAFWNTKLTRLRFLPEAWRIVVASQKTAAELWTRRPSSR